jgi:hypothetical protein
MRATWIGLGLGIAFVACGGSNKPAHVEISGKTPSEASAIAAQAVCAHDARCGRVVITCSGGGSAGGNDAAATMTCTGTIQPIRESIERLATMRSPSTTNSASISCSLPKRTAGLRSFECPSAV